MANTHAHAHTRAHSHSTERTGLLVNFMQNTCHLSQRDRIVEFVCLPVCQLDYAKYVLNGIFTKTVPKVAILSVNKVMNFERDSA